MTGWLAVVVVALLLAVVLQAATGFGFALLAGPSLYSVMAPARAVALLLILGLCVNVLVLAGERRRPAVDWRGLLPAMLAAIPGLPIGAGLVRVLPGDVLRIAIGIIVCSLVARRFLHRARARPPAPGAAAAIVAGFAAGVLTTSATTNGPLLALWLALGQPARAIFGLPLGQTSRATDVGHAHRSGDAGVRGNLRGNIQASHDAS